MSSAAPGRRADEAPAQRQAGIAFWVGMALGWPVIVYGLVGMLRHRVETRADLSARGLGRFLLGAVVLHDLVFAPLVLGAGLLVARAVPGRVRSIVQGALIVSGVAALYAYPAVRGFGVNPTNPTVLPRNYGAGLLTVVALVWGVAAVWAVVRLIRPRPG